MSLPKNSAAGRLIFALDVPGRDEAVQWAKRLRGCVGCFKVGLELFVREGPQVIEAVREAGEADIFLDLKLHDIPATVQGALESAAKLKVKFITVHAGDGGASFDKVALKNDFGLEVLGVTVLTSVPGERLPKMGYPADLTIEDLVLTRAALALDMGCSGVVCSGKEIRPLREKLGAGFSIVVPGIRPAWSVLEKDDQARIVTPAEAVQAGADYIVVGRPIREAKDPAEAAKKIVDETEVALGANRREL